MSHTMDHYENERVAERANFAGQCVSCYKQSTPTRIVGCTSCPENEELSSFLTHLHIQENMNLIREGANFQPYLPHLHLTDFPARAVFQMPNLQQIFAFPPMVLPPIALIYFPIIEEEEEENA